MITAIMGTDSAMGISNRGLNEVANYMKKNGHAFIAEHDIIPIVIQTAEEGRSIAVIEDKEIQSHVKYILGLMNNEC